MNKIHICEYGCGKEATHQFKNKRWCCSSRSEGCSESIRKNIERNLGRVHTQETKRKMSSDRKGEKNSMYGKVHTFESRIKIKENTLKNTPRGESHKLFGKSWVEVYGEEKAKILKENKRQKMLNFVVTEEMKLKRRKTMEENGEWIKEKDLSLLRLYTKEVLHFTYISIKEKFTIEDLKQRGMKKENGDKNLDHIFSIQEGFKLGIPPEIIGSKSNIRLINCNYNYSKKTKCDISLEDLYRKYNEEIKKES